MTENEAERAGMNRDAAETAHDDRPLLSSRRDRLRAYLRYNGERICRDTVILATWALVMMVWIQGFGVPRWACYIVTFAGVIGYTRVTAPWSRPYTSPDDFESSPMD